MLDAGAVLVMDNSLPTNAAAIAAIRRGGPDVLFLPPYSPDLNPIEKVWAKLKEILR